jgi:hypothetical protein
MRHQGERDGGRHAVGDAVELHTNFDGSWCAGFEIAEVLAVGEYRVRRRHDGVLLPEATSEGDVRAAWSGSQRTK